MLRKVRGDIARLLSPGDTDPSSRVAMLGPTRDATSPESVVGQGPNRLLCEDGFFVRSGLAT